MSIRRRSRREVLAAAVTAASLCATKMAAEVDTSRIEHETLLRTNSAWNGMVYRRREPGGQPRHFSAGQVIAETVDTWHRGRVGDKPAEFVVFYAGIKGMPLSLQKP